MSSRWRVLGGIFLLFAVTMPALQAAEVRQARVAGSFYPEEPAELLQNVTSLLAGQQADPGLGTARILIVPHAGYAYSGSIAARAYRQVQDQPYDGVVVVGFTHRVQFPGASLDVKDAYQTPLGKLVIHQKAVETLQRFPILGSIEEAHESGEHSMEVQLPFIQAALPETPVVPILMGNADWADAEQLAEALAALARTGNYLFVFSTDLSHYHAYNKALRIDARTVDALLHETPQAVNRLFNEGALEACGRGPIVTALLLAAKLGYPTRQLLASANSGDTAGQPDRVVGYAAIGLFERPAAPTEGRLAPEAGAMLVRGVRQTLAAYLRHPKEDIRIASLNHPDLAAAHGLFVTLRKGKELRGCIGRIVSDQPLSESLPQVALDAALRDPRFPPVTADELKDLRVEVSVLTPKHPIASAEEIVPGRDGVVLEHEEHRGVFLPTVWDETAWTREQFLSELASQKAGLAPDAWTQATLYAFESQVFAEPE